MDSRFKVDGWTWIAGYQRLHCVSAVAHDVADLLVLEPTGENRVAGRDVGRVVRRRSIENGRVKVAQLLGFFLRHAVGQQRFFHGSDLGGPDLSQKLSELLFDSLHQVTHELTHWLTPAHSPICLLPQTLVTSQQAWKCVRGTNATWHP